MTMSHSGNEACVAPLYQAEKWLTPVHLGVSGWQGCSLFTFSPRDTVSLFVCHTLHPETQVERVRGFGDWDGAGILHKKDLLNQSRCHCHPAGSQAIDTCILEKTITNRCTAGHTLIDRLTQEDSGLLLGWVLSPVITLQRALSSLSSISPSTKILAPPILLFR